MTSPHWDAARAAAYQKFQFEFTDKALTGRAVVVAGGAGGLGSATVALLAREGAKLIVGYRKDRERAERLRLSIEQQYGGKLLLVEGDLCEPGVRRNYVQKARELGAPITGLAIFSGDAARVPFSELSREAMTA